MKRALIALSIIILAFILLLTVDCSKNNPATPAQSVVPTLTTSAVSAIMQTTAECGGTVTTDGGATVTARGVCWSTNITPTVTDDKTTDGAGAGSFISSITGLTASTSYYVRAYATNSAGTGYGMTMAFTTLAPILPIVTTANISDISDTGAYCGGTITSDGGAPVTERGVCWSINPMPTVSGNKTRDGNGIGSFASQITGLTSGTSYYVRAYATNSAGIGYGDIMSFMTNKVPELMTVDVSEITETSAYCGGIIISDGGAIVTARGVCWSTDSLPTIADNKTIDGDGIGSFVSEISGLTADTIYYIRAYAINSVGAGYGNTVSFSTNIGSIMDIDGNVYWTVKIGNQWWIAENLKVTHYRNGNGDAIPNVVGISEWAALNTGAYCEYDDDANNVATYGRLYNWYAIKDARNLAPAGWHVASDAEWKLLEISIGMSQTQVDLTGWRGTDEGNKLKDTTHWSCANSAATNECGFSALPSGYRNFFGDYQSLGYNTNFGTFTEYSSTAAWSRYLSCEGSTICRTNEYKIIGFSVRCVKD